MSQRLSPTRELLRRFGINIPDVPEETPEQQAERDRKAKEAQAKDPLWKRFAREAVTAPASMLMGVLGADYSPDFKGATRPGATFQDIVQGVSELGTSGVGTVFAGLPFMHYAKNVLKQPFLTHGTRRTFEAFDPKMRDVHDVLGWQGMHAAERPGYSNQYSFGQTKHLGSPGNAPQTIAVQPEAKNVLDLVDPTADDMSAVLAAMTPENRARHIEEFKNARRAKRTIQEYGDESAVKTSIEKVGTAIEKAQAELRSIEAKKAGGWRHVDEEIESARDYLNLLLEERNILVDYLAEIKNAKQKLGHVSSAHYPEGIMNEPDTATRYLADRLRLQPEEYARTNFDAIRYRDIGEKAWAFNLDTPLKTPWGTPVSKPYTPPTVFSRFRPTPEGIKVSPSVHMKGQTPTPDEIENMLYSGKISPEEEGMLKNYFHSKNITAPGDPTKKWVVFHPNLDEPVIEVGSQAQAKILAKQYGYDYDSIADYAKYNPDFIDHLPPQWADYYKKLNQPVGVKSPKGLDTDIDKWTKDNSSTMFQFKKPAGTKETAKIVSEISETPIWVQGDLTSASPKAGQVAVAVYDSDNKLIELMTGNAFELSELLKETGILYKPGNTIYSLSASQLGAK